jgi:hypothetical protein
LDRRSSVVPTEGLATRVGFDNNTIDRMLRPENQPRVAPILECVESGALEFIGTDELLGEALRIVESPARAHELQRFGAVIGALTDGRHFRTPEAIMQSELRGPAELWATDADRRRLRGFLGAIAEGEPNMDNVRSIAAEMKQYVDGTAKGWRKLQATARERYAKASKADRSRVRQAPYELFQRKNWEATGPGFIRRFCRDYDVGDPDGVTARVIASPGNFPWVLRFQRIFAMILYWHLGQDRKVKDGDQNDAKQLYILPAVDIFLTEDTGFKKWATIIGDPLDKILTVDEFLDRSWC